ncbi:MAG: hypothetical protein U0Q22_10915 [Acidimicrobiales bacterium]
MFPRGVTGFWSSTDPDPPVTDRRSVFQVVHEAAWAAGGHAVEVETDAGIRSYWELEVACPDIENVSVLVNRSHPIAAFARTGSFPPSFIECPRIGLSLGEVLTVLSASEAERAPSKDDLARLGEAEMRQVRAWRPEKLGWVAFNWWD